MSKLNLENFSARNETAKPLIPDPLPTDLRRSSGRQRPPMATIRRSRSLGETFPTSHFVCGNSNSVVQLARGLIARGVGKGTRIGFIYCNGPMFAVLFAAYRPGGCVAVPISTLIRSNELVRVLRQSDVAGLDRPALHAGQRLCGAPVRSAAAAGSGWRSPDLRLPQAPFLRWIASSGKHCPAAFTQWSGSPRSDAVSRSAAAGGRVGNSHHGPDGRNLHLRLDGAAQGRASTITGPVMFRTHYIRAR